MNRIIIRLLVIILVPISAIVWYESYVYSKPIGHEEATPIESIWSPTEEDIAYQDSMYTIIEQTSADVDTIKVAIDHILYKLERLEYADGTYDSIRYIEGGPIDRSRNQLRNE